jgi:hypothetical protein
MASEGIWTFMVTLLLLALVAGKDWYVSEDAPLFTAKTSSGVMSARTGSF